MSKISYYENQRHASGLSFYIEDVDAYPEDESGTVLAVIHKERGAELEDIYVSILFEMSWDKDSIDLIWEPDGEATYVPYGNTSVMYDDGAGGPDYADFNNFKADYEKHIFVDFEDCEIELTKEQVLNMLGCSESDLEEIVNNLKPLAIGSIKDTLEDYYSDPYNWPEKPEYEPDYDDWYLDRDDWN